MFHQIHSPCASVALDLRVGHLRGFAAQHDNRKLTPLFTAPWADQAISHDPPVERYLSGDFFCAPFAESDIEPAPLHGWSANSAWSLTENISEAEAIFALNREILGARLFKHLRCAPDAPVLYQCHWFVGGSGAIPVAHHVVTHMQNGGQISHSPKRLALTPDAVVGTDMNALQYPAQSDDLTRFPAPTGVADLTRFPLSDCHDDFVALIDAQTQQIGWTAVLRNAEDDILIVLRDAAVLPTTMLWFAHGSLRDPPWNGLQGVLGIEDGCSGLHSGHRRSLEPSQLTELGVRTALNLRADYVVEIRHAIVAVARPDQWNAIDRITVRNGTLEVTEAGGKQLCLPFDDQFFADQNASGSA